MVHEVGGEESVEPRGVVGGAENGREELEDARGVRGGGIRVGSDLGIAHSRSSRSRWAATSAA